MKFISAIYMSRRNFWCMTRGVVNKNFFISRREMEDSQEARTWWKQWIWVEKLIFPVSVTQKEQLSGVFIFDFKKSAFLAHPNRPCLGLKWVIGHQLLWNRSPCKRLLEKVAKTGHPVVLLLSAAGPIYIFDLLTKKSLQTLIINFEKHSNKNKIKNMWFFWC